MSRPKKTFADALDIFMETASEDEIRGIVASVAVWARVRRLGFRVYIEDAATRRRQWANAKPSIATGSGESAADSDSRKDSPPSSRGL